MMVTTVITKNPNSEAFHLFVAWAIKTIKAAVAVAVVVIYDIVVVEVVVKDHR